MCDTECFSRGLTPWSHLTLQEMSGPVLFLARTISSSCALWYKDTEDVVMSFNRQSIFVIVSSLLTLQTLSTLICDPIEQPVQQGDGHPRAGLALDEGPANDSSKW